ncbi:hypothetical protein [Streptomyces sp. NPDC017958]|uniref:hypothetical protein n=1 Tax=Streptomyces sp. NPDC017958 TaxID=3365021 RepID=UPI00378B0E2B
MAHRTQRWRAPAVTATAAGLIARGLAAPPASAATDPRVDLRVLVVDDGGSPVGAITAQLRSEGIPYTTVDLGDSRVGATSHDEPAAEKRPWAPDSPTPCPTRYSASPPAPWSCTQP